MKPTRIQSNNLLSRFREPGLLKIGNGEYAKDDRGNIFAIVGTCLGYLARKLMRIK